MWGRCRKIHACLSLLGALPATQAFSTLSGIPGSSALSSVMHASIPYNRYASHSWRQNRRSKSFNQLRLSSSTLEENNSSWDEPDLEETVNDEDEDETVSSPLMEEYQSWSTALKKAIKALEKKRNSLQLEYDKAQGVEDTVARAQLLVSNLYLFTPGVKTATVQDWENDCVDVELTLNPKYDSANAEADAMFAQARKLKRGSQIVKELLEETADAWDLFQEAQTDLESACVENEVEQGQLALVQDRLKRSSRKTNFQIPSPPSPPEQGSKSRTKSNGQPSKPVIGSPQSNIRKLMSPGGCIVFVGRNRRGNDNLSMTIARGNDIWMHSRGCPGKSLSADLNNYG
jgi:predicted ribosome quality control (RQC) complex YloA/Tae2 family protein